MRDFTVTIYKKLLNEFSRRKYRFKTFADFMALPEDNSLVLRHDVDNRKFNSLKFAQTQHDLGISGTYYFRMVPQSYDEEVIEQISSLGHEIGYHYETMDKANGDVKNAYDIFCRELEKIRKIVPVKTICMHGSPLSKYDNREIWKYYDYRDLGIIAEPYFDLDFSKILYLTDTGRRWNGSSASIRDNVPGPSINKFMTDGKHSLSEQYLLKSTQDIIDACKQGVLPNKIMLNFHPQRWTNKTTLWLQELFVQNIKNVLKTGLKKIRS
jgi:hypothetical protein